MNLSEFEAGLVHVPKAQPKDMMRGNRVNVPESQPYAGISNDSLYLSKAVTDRMKALSKYVEVYWHPKEKCIVFRFTNLKTETSRVFTFGANGGATMGLKRFLRVSGAGEYLSVLPYKKFEVQFVSDMLIISLRDEFDV